MASKEKPISGIYGIYCANSDKWYVGASKNIISRLKYHFAEMRADASAKNHADFIGRAYHWEYHGEIGRDYWLYGESSFTCHILVETEDQKLFTEIENYYINDFDSLRNGYNSKLSCVHRSWND